MTVREAFRRERARLWSEDPTFAADIDKLAAGCCESPQQFVLKINGVPHAFVPDLETFLRRERMLDALRTVLNDAIERAYPFYGPHVIPNVEKWWRNWTSENPTPAPRN